MSPIDHRAEAAPAGRWHALDALRAFALLLGVVYHAALAYVLPPGAWAVGATKAMAGLSWFISYAHSFRMEVFFLLAGFFARLVIARRGTGGYVKDRGRRILLVFLLGLYPMKLMLTALWITGGRLTGWLRLPPFLARVSVWRLSFGSLTSETWPHIGLTHLWFLYYLACISALFLVGRGLVGKFMRRSTAWRSCMHAGFHRLAGSWLAPLALALIVSPLLARMKGPEVDTPDKGFNWDVPVMLLYGFFFCVGWLLHRHADLLAVFASRWQVYLPVSLVVSIPSWVVAGHLWTDAAASHTVAYRWAGSFLLGLTMAFCVYGWLGLFLRTLHRSRAWVRYLADSSYWVYLAHLPLVVGLQVLCARWEFAWWVKLAFVLGVAGAVLLASYHLMVRFTWIGRWLNGPRNASGTGVSADAPPVPAALVSRPP